MNQSVSILTSVTVDYIPQTIATLKSAHCCSSFYSYHVFVCDAKASTVEKIRLLLGDDAPYIEFFGVDDLQEDMRISYLNVFRYFNPFEVSNLAKYVGILHLFRSLSAVTACAYIDSDTLFFGDVLPLIKQQIQGSAVYLTPHILGASNSDNEHDIMINGWVNAGFFVFNKEHQNTIPILEWLINRISILGFSAPPLGLFVDQKWLSSLPTVFHNDVFISEYEGLNVAYWNLDQRLLTGGRGNEILVNGKKLIMFHYSGFDERNDNILSKHASIILEPGSILDELCKKYRNDLLSINLLRDKLKGLATITCSSASLNHRIRLCESIHQVSLFKSMPRPGIATLFGSKIDAVWRKLLGSYRTLFSIK